MDRWSSYASIKNFAFLQASFLERQSTCSIQIKTDAHSSKLDFSPKFYSQESYLQSISYSLYRISLEIHESNWMICRVLVFCIYLLFSLFLFLSPRRHHINALGFSFHPDALPSIFSHTPSTHSGDTHLSFTILSPPSHRACPSLVIHFSLAFSLIYFFCCLCIRLPSFYLLIINYLQSSILSSISSDLIGEFYISNLLLQVLRQLSNNIFAFFLASFFSDNNFCIFSSFSFLFLSISSLSLCLIFSMISLRFLFSWSLASEDISPSLSLTFQAYIQVIGVHSWYNLDSLD